MNCLSSLKLSVLSANTSVVVIHTTKSSCVACEAMEWRLGQSVHSEKVSSLLLSPSPGHIALGGSSSSCLPAAHAPGLLSYLHGTDNSILEVRIQQVWGEG